MHAARLGRRAQRLQKRGLKKGHTTEDGLFTLTEVECLGACANAPMVQINDDNYEDLTEESMGAILDALAAGEDAEAGPQVDRQTSCPKAARPRSRKWPSATTITGGMVIGIILAVVVGIILFGVVFKLLKIAVIIALWSGSSCSRRTFRDQADQMTIVAILVAVVVGFLVLRFIAGMVKFGVIALIAIASSISLYARRAF